MIPILDAAAPDTARLAAEKLTEGGLLLYPTDTVYGLGCNALNTGDVQRLYSIKIRHAGKPFLLLLGNMSRISHYFDTRAEGPLIKKVWPGPFTILLKPRTRAFTPFEGVNGKVGARWPDDPFLNKLLNLFHQPLVSTSANLSGSSYKHDWKTIEKLFKNRVDMMVKRHPYTLSRPSAVIEWERSGWKVHREGPLPLP